MPVRADPTPNPNAMKFTVGEPVGGPATHVAGSRPEEPYLKEILALDGVGSVFVTGDFVTVTKATEAAWDTLGPEISSILESHFRG